MRSISLRVAFTHVAGIKRIGRAVQSGDLKTAGLDLLKLDPEET